MLILAISLTCT